MLVVGGGATGVGIAVDAAQRGYSVLLLEQSDFGKGASSRSTKLIHGGVRYLQQGNITLVMEALRERALLRKNAPHLVHELAFVVPNYGWWEAPLYGIGLKVYDLLAGRYGFGSSRVLSKKETLKHIPTLKTDGLRGGVMYYDGQFDDARLLIHLVWTAFEHAATLLNYARVVRLKKDPPGHLSGVVFEDLETGQQHEAAARVVINATGPFADSLRRMDEPDTPAIMSPSQGIHIVLDPSFLPGGTAIMVPHTRDGRILFAIPYLGATLVGTTDTPVDSPSLEPLPQEQEIEFVLETAAAYLDRKPTKDDILSVSAGIRPLIKSDSRRDTASLSRDHSIVTANSGLITIAGGKWTTYRRMAEDCVTHAATRAGLDPAPCTTEDLPIHGYHETAASFGDLAIYGSDAPALEKLLASNPELNRPLHQALPTRAGEVLWATRFEWARTVEDFLARRTRALLLNARVAVEMAPTVARLMAGELSRGTEWESEQVRSFQTLAAAYLPRTG